MEVTKYKASKNIEKWYFLENHESDRRTTKKKKTKINK